VFVDFHLFSVSSLLFSSRRTHSLRCHFQRLPGNMSKQGAFEMRVGADSSSLTEATEGQDAMDMRRLGKKQELNVCVQNPKQIRSYSR
jgi:hypothetical protein